MIDPVEISRGYWNLTRSKFGMTPKDMEDEANRKLGICRSCHVHNPSLNTCDSSKGGCGCYLPAKVRTSQECPIGKW